MGNRRSFSRIGVAALLVVAAVVSLAPVLGGPASAQGSVTVTGTLTVQFASPHGAADPVITLATDSGDSWRLDLDESVTAKAGGFLALDRTKVEVTGAQTAATGASGAQPPVMSASSIRPVAPPSAAPGGAPEALTGSQSFVTILCRFGDSPGVTPREPSYFDGLLGPTAPGISHFWKENSFNLIDNQGSAVVGWYNLPQPRSYYVPSSGVSHERLAQDCTAAANAAVNFNSYLGINLIFNESLGCCAWGGGWFMTLDGTAQTWPMTWMPPWGYTNQDVLGHEMGHAYGLLHSGGQYGNAYDSNWDVMSGGGTCSPYDPVYGCVGVHTIGFHKDQLNWIPPGRKYVAGPLSNQTITLEDLAAPAVGAGSYLLAQVPIGGSSTEFYTVEARKFVGYDQGVPADAVVIHQVSTPRDRPAQVVDADSNGNPNDAGAAWVPGETFSDPSTGVTVEVLSSVADRFLVRIALGTATAPPNDDYPGTTVAAPRSGQPSVFTANTITATTQPGEPANVCAVPTGKTVWYRFVAPVAGPLTISTAGSGFDTVLAVFTGGAVGNLAPVPGACNDDSGSTLQSQVDFNLAPNVEYFVQAGGWNGGSGALKVTFTGDFAVASGTAPSDDFDGDGRTDHAVYRPDTGFWFVHQSSGGDAIAPFGTDGDIPVPGDYDGDDTTDRAVFRPSTGLWFVDASTGPDQVVPFGAPGDAPVPGDFDGDGRTDEAVFRPSSGLWFVHQSSGGDTLTAFGTSGDIPVPGDYDGDGASEIAVFRPGNGFWFVHDGAATAFGTSGDIPVPGDYDGDGSTDLAVFRPSTGFWFAQRGLVAQFGTAGDIPAPGDYSGGGPTNPGVFRPASGFWFTPGAPIVAFGAAGDVPLPLPDATRRVFFPPL